MENNVIKNEEVNKATVGNIEYTYTNHADKMLKETQAKLEQCDIARGKVIIRRLQGTVKSMGLHITNGTSGLNRLGEIIKYNLDEDNFKAIGFTDKTFHEGLIGVIEDQAPTVPIESFIGSNYFMIDAHDIALVFNIHLSNQMLADEKESLKPRK